eukprot:3558054-Amphidinium_carterae.1
MEWRKSDEGVSGWLCNRDGVRGDCGWEASGRHIEYCIGQGHAPGQAPENQHSGKGLCWTIPQCCFRRGWCGGGEDANRQLGHVESFSDGAIVGGTVSPRKMDQVGESGCHSTCGAGCGNCWMSLKSSRNVGFHANIHEGACSG